MTLMLLILARLHQQFVKENELARPVMGTIFLVMSVCLVCQINCVGGITWTKHAHAQSLLFFFGG